MDTSSRIVHVCMNEFKQLFLERVERGEDQNIIKFFLLLEWIASKPGSKNIKRVKRGC